jgi:hypothetical protein
MTRTSVGGMGTLKNRPNGRKHRLLFPWDDAFWLGVANAFNIIGYFTPRYYGRNPDRADQEALRSDWAAIGRDIEQAISRFEADRAKALGRED